MAEKLAILRNTYWILRHGKSVPNENGLIVSSMENGILPEYGLASEGVKQARLAGELLNKELKEDVLGIPFESSQCKVMVELRERFFGPSFELLSHDKYPEIWALDANDPFMPPEGGESVADVVSRLSKALVESAYKVFDEMGERNLGAWNAVLIASAQHGHTDAAFDRFREMERVSGYHPNHRIPSHTFTRHGFWHL